MNRWIFVEAKLLVSGTRRIMCQSNFQWARNASSRRQGGRSSFTLADLSEVSHQHLGSLFGRVVNLAPLVHEISSMSVSLLI